MDATDLRLSWRNLGRNRKRTVLAWSGIALAQAMLVWLSSFMNGYEALIFQKLTGPMLGHAQLHAPKYRDDNAIERTIGQAARVLERVKGAPHVAGASPRVYGPALATREQLGHVALVTGVELAAETRESGLLEGLAKDQWPGAGEVLVGSGLAGEMGARPGDTLALMGQGVDGSVASGLFKVKAVIQPDVEQLNRSGLVMSLAAARELLAMGDEAHEIVVHVDRPENVEAAVAALRADRDLQPLEISSWRDLVPQIAAFLEVADSINLIILALIFLTTVAGIANTMLMATFERSHELGMLLALGCRPARLMRLLLLESLILGVSGVLIGSVLGIWIVWVEMRHGISLPGLGGSAGVFITLEGVNIGAKFFPILRAGDVLRGVAAVVVTAAIAAVWPARRISRLEPVEAMRS